MEKPRDRIEEIRRERFESCNVSDQHFVPSCTPPHKPVWIKNENIFEAFQEVYNDANIVNEQLSMTLLFGNQQEKNAFDRAIAESQSPFDIMNFDSKKIHLMEDFFGCEDDVVCVFVSDNKNGNLILEAFYRAKRKLYIVSGREFLFKDQCNEMGMRYLTKVGQQEKVKNLAKKCRELEMNFFSCELRDDDDLDNDMMQATYGCIKEMIMLVTEYYDAEVQMRKFVVDQFSEARIKFSGIDKNKGQYSVTIQIQKICSEFEAYQKYVDATDEIQTPDIIQSFFDYIIEMVELIPPGENRTDVMKKQYFDTKEMFEDVLGEKLFEKLFEFLKIRD